MSRRKKLSDEDCKKIAEQINRGHQIKDLAEKYSVDKSYFYRRCKGLYESRKITVEIKNKVIKAIKQGYTKAEAAQLCNLTIGTVNNYTTDIKGHITQDYHVLRKSSIKLLQRLLCDGYLITDFIFPTVRNLQKHFPMIKSARYSGKTFFYIEGREEETIEAFFREKPDRIISYSAIEELSHLLSVKITNKNQRKLLEKFKGKHDDSWKNRCIIQRSIDDWIDESKSSETSFRLMSIL